MSALRSQDQKISQCLQTTTKAYKDSIGTLQVLYGWGFMEVVNYLRDYKM